ncbi:MAG TPA: hypothetical protein VHE53_04040 [Patescibacteria group bacterium]|nr:hypothetical protein [Patescibacteria group bacterium]
MVENGNGNNEKLRIDNLRIAPLAAVVGSKTYVDNLSKNLRDNGVITLPAYDMKEVELSMSDIRLDAIILDEWTYWEDGMKVVRNNKNTPPLYVSANNIKGVNIFGRRGIDVVISESDYSATAARLKDRLARRLARVNSVIKLGSIEVDLNNHTVGNSEYMIRFVNSSSSTTSSQINPGFVPFSARQWSFLTYLAIDVGRAVGDRELRLRFPDFNSTLPPSSEIKQLKSKLGVYSNIISETPDGKYALARVKKV